MTIGKMQPTLHEDAVVYHSGKFIHFNHQVIINGKMNLDCYDAHIHIKRFEPVFARSWLQFRVQSNFNRDWFILKYLPWELGKLSSSRSEFWLTVGPVFQWSSIKNPNDVPGWSFRVLFESKRMIIYINHSLIWVSLLFIRRLPNSRSNYQIDFYFDVLDYKLVLL